MPQILVEDLSKSYRVSERSRGLVGALKGLFRRRYRTVEALKRISFSLERGELLGFIGPNGAGKSTTIKILSGILEPDSGRCEIDGIVPWRERIRHVARIGVVFGQRTQLWWDLPVGDGFDLLRDIYSVPDAEYRRTRDQLVVLMRLERLLDQPVRQLSLGQRMRCEITAISAVLMSRGRGRSTTNSSRMLPGLGDINTIRSPRQTASRTLCVTSMIVFLRSSQMRCRSK